MLGGGGTRSVFRRASRAKENFTVYFLWKGEHYDIQTRHINLFLFLRMIIIWVSFLENYHDCLNDAKAATALQPSYLKAIIRGENEYQLKI